MRLLVSFVWLALTLQAGEVLWYQHPARTWSEALPVGNGRLGAMIFGGVPRERIQFNEHSVWTGEPHDYAHPGAYKHLGAIRELLFAGRQKDAEGLATREFMSVPVRQKAYQPFRRYPAGVSGRDRHRLPPGTRSQFRHRLGRIRAATG